MCFLLLLAATCAPKKELNTGAGWYTQKEATSSKAITVSAPEIFTQRNFGLAVYMEIPENKKKGTAVNAYSVFYKSDYKTIT